MEKNKAIVLGLNIGIALAVVASVIIYVNAIINFVVTTSDNIPENAYLYRLEDQDYENVMDFYHRDTKPTENKEYYYRIARYFEAKSLYVAFGQAGDEVLTLKYLKRMEAEHMDDADMIMEKERIDQMFSEKLFLDKSATVH